MLGDIVIVDAVVHGMNFTPENYAIPEAHLMSTGTAGMSAFLSANDASRLSATEVLRDWQVEDLEEALFLESPVDLAVYHGTPIYDFYKDGLSAISKGYEMRKRTPHRVLVYGPVNPLEGKKALADMERLVKEHQVNGIKIYAANYSKGHSYPVALDDPEFGFPFIEKAIDLGVKVIAIHKAAPLGPIHPALYGMKDIPEPAARYPEMNFEIVHTGFAFLEESAFLAGAFPNVWFNLEASGSFVIPAPRRYADFMGLLLSNGAENRIFHATGCALVHPKPTIDALLNFEMPEELVTGYGYPRMTAEIKRKILGENFLRMHGIDPAEVKANVSNDDWHQKRAANPEAEPWSHLRRRLASRPHPAGVAT